ncbi:unnamed protein product, partial [marine sediment metagenome]
KLTPGQVAQDAAIRITDRLETFLCHAVASNLGCAGARSSRVRSVRVAWVRPGHKLCKRFRGGASFFLLGRAGRRVMLPVSVAGV